MRTFAQTHKSDHIRRRSDHAGNRSPVRTGTRLQPENLEQLGIDVPNSTREKKAELENNQQVLKSLQKVPLMEFVRRGLIVKPKTSEQRVDAPLKFFGLGSLDAWNTRIAESSAAFRKPEGIDLKHEIVEGCGSIEKLCNQAGVAFAVVQPLRGTGVFGAARWLSPNKALIQLAVSSARKVRACA